MAKISDFGNAWGKFICRGETHAVHLARHPSPLHGKNRAKWHHLQKIFSAWGSSSSYSHFTLKCPKSSFLETSFKIFFLQRHSVQHSLQRVLSLNRQFSFHLPLPIYMAKTSVWGNTYGRFLKKSSCRSKANGNPVGHVNFTTCQFPQPNAINFWKIWFMKQNTYWKVDYLRL